MLAEKNIHSQVDSARLHTFAMLINIYREQGVQGYVVIIYNRFFIDAGFFPSNHQDLCKLLFSELEKLHSSQDIVIIV
jgi:hypothetical protein